MLQTVYINMIVFVIFVANIFHHVFYVLQISYNNMTKIVTSVTNNSGKQQKILARVLHILYINNGHEF